MKNCLVVIRNKKLNINGGALEQIERTFAAGGYYFDKVAFVAYDSSTDIAGQLKECRESFDNAVVLCPSSQTAMIAQFLAKQYGGAFDRDGVLSAGDKSVFLAESEGDYARRFALAVSLLNEKYATYYDKMYVKLVGAPSELVDEAIARASSLGGDMTFAVRGRYGETTIEITYSNGTSKMVADGALRECVAVLGDYIYALEDISLAEQLYRLLKLRRMKLSVAESFTGGGICARLVEVPGISEVFFEGLNTYANESKTARLGVKQVTLMQSGAVSEETAYQMAEGLLAGGHCNVAVATTGIAGPKSDNTNKPVGLAYIAVGVQDSIRVYKFNFAGDRNTITQSAINRALFLVYKTLK